MELKFTKEQLIEAFKIYNNQVIDNPNDFGTIDSTEQTAESQAETLIAILKSLGQESKAALEWFKEAKQKGHEWAQLAIDNSKGSIMKYPSMSKALVDSFVWSETPEGIEFWGKLHDVVLTVEQEHPFK